MDTEPRGEAARPRHPRALVRGRLSPFTHVASRHGEEGSERFAQQDGADGLSSLLRRGAARGPSGRRAPSLHRPGADRRRRATERGLTHGTGSGPSEEGREWAPCRRPSWAQRPGCRGHRRQVRNTPSPCVRLAPPRRGAPGSARGPPQTRAHRGPSRPGLRWLGVGSKRGGKARGTERRPRRQGRFSRMRFNEKFLRAPVISTSQGSRDLGSRNFALGPPNSNCRKYL